MKPGRAIASRRRHSGRRRTRRITLSPLGLLARVVLASIIFFIVVQYWADVRRALFPRAYAPGPVIVMMGVATTALLMLLAERAMRRRKLGK